MKSYNVKIRFTTDYLQARFTENSKKELEEYVSRGIIKSTEDSWKVLLYEDENGIYIPSNQFRKSITIAGKQFKMKKSRASLFKWANSNILVGPERIYIGKMEPDEVLVSYPARKDGNRVVLKHPVIKAGTEVDFIVKSFDDEMENKTVENLIIESGKMNGVGARRVDMYGRFELIGISIIK